MFLISWMVSYRNILLYIHLPRIPKTKVNLVALDNLTSNDKIQQCNKQHVDKVVKCWLWVFALPPIAIFSASFVYRYC